MSFKLTTDQILARTKTVTRRMNWKFLKPGDLVQAIEKGQGLKKGEKVRKLCVIRVTDVHREVLEDGVSQSDVAREGFPQMTPQQFVGMFCASHAGCGPASMITRIVFEYVDGGGA